MFIIVLVLQQYKLIWYCHWHVGPLALMAERMILVGISCTADEQFV